MKLYNRVSEYVATLSSPHACACSDLSPVFPLLPMHFERHVMVDFYLSLHIQQSLARPSDAGEMGCKATL